ncbi:MAG: PorT family protein [Flavobacteriaceae bacterium]|nr:PorT family protein [Flavobacteriaceae bacterium]
MKKIFLLVALIAIQFSYSQGNMRFGMKLGGNLSSIIETARDSKSGLNKRDNGGSKMGFHGGITFEFLFSERISVQVEALYSTKGGKVIDSNSTRDNSEVVDYLNYISFPILGKYYATPNLSIELGPEISLLSSAKNEDSKGIEVNISKQRLQHDLGLVGGLAYEFYNGVFIQGRYSLGLLDITNTNKNSIAYYRHKNSVIQVSVGFIF